MDDVSDVSLVHSHAKRDGGDDDLDAARHEVILNFGLVLYLHAGVKCRSIETLAMQLSGQFVGFLRYA